MNRAALPQAGES